MEILTGTGALLLAVGALQIAGERGSLLGLGPRGLRIVAGVASLVALHFLLATGAWLEAIVAWWICLSAAGTLVVLLRPLAPRALDMALVAMPLLLLAAKVIP